jgi:hypothetical protein
MDPPGCAPMWHIPEERLMFSTESRFQGYLDLLIFRKPCKQVLLTRRWLYRRCRRLGEFGWIDRNIELHNFTRRLPISVLQLSITMALSQPTPTTATMDGLPRR